jgi:hypothetical protein
VQDGSYSLTARATDIPGQGTTTPATDHHGHCCSEQRRAHCRHHHHLTRHHRAAQTNVVINATASDPDGSVAKVEFFRADGATKLGEDTTAPYSYTWRNPPPGDHLLRVRATDNVGAVSALSHPCVSWCRGESGVPDTAATPEWPPLVRRRTLKKSTAPRTTR